MKEKFILEADLSGVALRTAAESDGEDLRQWKNANRHFFFYQEIISPEQQEKWFQGYLARSDDTMFIVSKGERPIGCIGFRVLEENRIDIYNVILGDPALGGKGLMSQAMQLMCSYIVQQSMAEIVAKVLNSNPALEWYLRNGFHKGKSYDSYTEVVFDRSRFHSYPFRKINLD